jgi:hypothetical protein
MTKFPAFYFVLTAEESTKLLKQRIKVSILWEIIYQFAAKVNINPSFLQPIFNIQKS